jgi:large subunit ribosomal protein L10
LEEKLQKASIAISTEFRGVSVAEMAELRRELRAAGVEYLVVKNTLARIAADNAGVSGLSEVLQGPTAIAFGYDGDVVEPAKRLTEHIRTSRVNVAITGAIMDGQILRGPEVRALATIPPKPVLVGQLMGGLLAPLNGVVYALTYHIGGLARVLDARRQQMEEAGG